jgi:phage terminase large subunit-like protein
MIGLNYIATKTAAEFHKDNSFVRFLFGCVGSGKSVAGCIEVFPRAINQAPGFDGVRRTRFAVVRNTYPDLKSTTLENKVGLSYLSALAI